MGETATLRGRTLEFPKTWLEHVGIEENSSVRVELQDRELVIKPLSEAEAAQERLLAHLSLPVGALTDEALNPDEPISLYDEIGGDLYEDID